MAVPPDALSAERHEQPANPVQRRAGQEQRSAADCEAVRRPVLFPIPIMAMPHVTESGPATFVVRQPIMDVAERVYGYDLRFRDVATSGGHDDDERNAARVLTDAILTIGLETLANKKPAFLTFTRDLLINGAATLLPASAIVACVPGSLGGDLTVLDACKALHAGGYTLAIDDFRGGPADGLLPFAKFVKIDIGTVSSLTVASTVARVGTRAQVIASRVESPEAYAAAKAAGCRFFQGFYFCEPVMRPAQVLPAKQLAYVNLLTALNKPSLTIAELEDLVKRDASLAYRVLRSVNSAAFVGGREITSIRQALVLLGIDQVRKWASVWSLAGLGGGSASETMSLALIRARCCELIGQRLSGSEAADQLFLLGLCSLLDTILSRPIELAIADVQVPTDVRDALLGVRNFARTVLDGVIAVERADWTRATTIAADAGIPESVLSKAYADALPWACQLSSVA